MNRPKFFEIRAVAALASGVIGFKWLLSPEANVGDALVQVISGMTLVAIAIVVYPRKNAVKNTEPAEPEKPPVPKSHRELDSLLEECKAKWAHWPQVYRDSMLKEVEKKFIALVNAEYGAGDTPESLASRDRLSKLKDQLYLRAS